MVHQVPSTTEENCSSLIHTQHWECLQHCMQRKDPKIFNTEDRITDCVTSRLSDSQVSAPAAAPWDTQFLQQ